MALGSLQKELEFFAMMTCYKTALGFTVCSRQGRNQASVMMLLLFFPAGNAAEWMGCHRACVQLQQVIGD